MHSGRPGQHTEQAASPRLAESLLLKKLETRRAAEEPMNLRLLALCLGAASAAVEVRLHARDFKISKALIIGTAPACSSLCFFFFFVQEGKWGWIDVDAWTFYLMSIHVLSCEPAPCWTSKTGNVDEVLKQGPIFVKRRAQKRELDEDV